MLRTAQTTAFIYEIQTLSVAFQKKDAFDARITKAVFISQSKLLQQESLLFVVIIRIKRVVDRLYAATSGEWQTDYWAHMMVLPPSTGNWAPVVKLASSLARNAIAFATSSGCP